MVQIRSLCTSVRGNETQSEKQNHRTRDQISSPVNEFDLLYIDTEGYDGKIVTDFLNKNKLRPFIIFEYIHINHKILNKTLNTLKEKKFFFFKIDENIISIPEEKKSLVN